MNHRCLEVVLKGSRAGTRSGSSSLPAATRESDIVVHEAPVDAGQCRDWGGEMSSNESLQNIFLTLFSKMGAHHTIDLQLNQKFTSVKQGALGHGTLLRWIDLV